MRKYKRQIARARMTALGIDRVNRKMAKNTPAGKLWRQFLTGKYAEQGKRAQIGPTIRRRIRKISPVTG